MEECRRYEPKDILSFALFNPEEAAAVPAYPAAYAGKVGLGCSMWPFATLDNETIGAAAASGHRLWSLAQFAPITKRA